MNEMRIMVVEDEPDQRDIFKDTVRVYMKESGITVKYEFAETVKDAKNRIDGTFDGVIIDLKLKDQPEGGNTVIQEMEKALFRVPVIVVSGHPESAAPSEMIIRTRSRDARTYKEDLMEFYDLYKTGLTHIMGGRGTIEQELTKVFCQNLLHPDNQQAWIKHGQSDSLKTEKALLRFTLNHLMQILDDDDEECFPEEVFIYPPLQQGLKTGSIVKKKDSKKLYIILSPPCDLVIRESGQMKTDKVLLVEIDEEEMVYNHVITKIEDLKEKEKKLLEILNNKHSLFHHWLPKTTFFPGGFINFRKLSTLSKKDYQKQYHEPHVQISPYFVKDILSRFSSYYARQGQPDIKCEQIISKIVETSGT